MPYDTIDPSLLQMNQQPNFSWQSRLANGAQGFLGNRDLALALLANSGPSTQKRSFGQILGGSMLQADQAKRDRQQEDIMNAYRMMQMQHLQNQGSNPWGSIPVERVTPESRKKFEQTGKYSDLEFIPEQRQMVDTAEMKNFNFRNSLTPEQQVQFDNIVRNQYQFKDINGVQSQIRQGQVPQVTPLTSLDSEAAAQAQIAQAKGYGESTGKASGDIAAKAPAKASFDIAANNLDKQISATPTGGFLGVRGKAASVTDKTEADTFDSRVQQLSTELRTVFRIPGEGSLSDQEQAQYGLQLPNRKFNKETNERIMKDLRQRVAARTSTPIGAPAATSSAAEPDTNTVNWADLK